MMSMLRPGYSPPGRKKLEGSLLNETTEALQDEMRKKLLGKDCTSIEDRWNDVHNDPISAMCLYADNGAFF